MMICCIKLMGRSSTYMLGLGTFAFSLVLIIEPTKLALSSNIKVGLSPSKKKIFFIHFLNFLRLICFNDSPLKMMYLMSWLFGHIEKKRFDWNNTHILPNTSQSKCNQTIKFGQLREYNKGSISFFVSKTAVVELIHQIELRQLRNVTQTSIY